MKLKTRCPISSFPDRTLGTFVVFKVLVITFISTTTLHLASASISASTNSTSNHVTSPFNQSQTGTGSAGVPSSGSLGVQLAANGGADTSLCLPGFFCIHGECIGPINCRCEDGWAGAMCTDAVVPPPATIVSNDSSTVEVPTTPDGNNDKSNSTKSALEKNNSTLAPQFAPDVGKFSPLEGYGPLRDISLRRCIEGFECRYGNCSNVHGFKCLCDPGFTGFFCESPCPRDCGPYGQCKLDPVRCECDEYHRGESCSVVWVPDADPEETPNWVIAGAAVGAMVLLMVVAGMVIYVLWRRGNIAVLKLVFWFQNFEEDDGRLYDAFVSYASTNEDRNFVVEQLVPVLENEMGFTLCIHERDFLPGKYITANILDSVRQSRRTLLVISPEFVSRNWCQFEFQTAVAEMIEQKHRILPVILGDLNKIKEISTMCETLQRILHTITYLQYPEDESCLKEIEKFWTRLELSMPKKPSQSESNSSPPTPSSSLNQTLSPFSSPVTASPTQLIPGNSSSHRQNKSSFPLFPQTNCSSDVSGAQSPGSKAAESPKHSNKHNNFFSSWRPRLFGRRKRSATLQQCAKNFSLQEDFQCVRQTKETGIWTISETHATHLNTNPLVTVKGEEHETREKNNHSSSSIVPDP